ncbi:MAG: hypothetical protein OEX16_05570 [Hadesarchaea archaeon]|nr:hypothetical protein [Hadesarchaea archaeon]
MPRKIPKKLKPILIAGYILGVFSIIFLVGLYLYFPLDQCTKEITLIIIFLIGAFLVSIVHVHRKLRRGEVRIKRAKDRPEPQPAAILFAVIPGLIGLLGIGHLYLGKRRRGACYLLFGLLVTALVISLPLVYPPSVFSLEFVFILCIYTVAWVWQIVDAYRLARA